MANVLNTLNLIQVKGGVNIKQGDSRSELEYELGYNDNSDTMNDLNLDGKEAKIRLYNKIKNTKWDTSSIVKGNRVSFTIDEPLGIGVYVIDIEVDGHVFPSNSEMFVRIHEGYQSYMDGEEALVAVATAKNIADEAIRLAVLNNAEKIRGPKGDTGIRGLTGKTGPQGIPGEASKVISSKYDSDGNTVITFNNNSPTVTIQRGKQGLKGDTGNPVNVASISKSGTTNTVKFTDGKTLQVKDGEGVTVSSYRFLTNGDTELTFSDGFKAIVKKGQDGTVDFNKLTKEQKQSLVVPVVDDLTSGGKDKALSAEQGKEINTALADLANKVASIKPGYGVGDFIQLGNLKAVVEGELLPVKDWEFTGHNAWISSVAVDDQGNVYSGGDSKKVIKISPSGSKIWEFTGHTKRISCVAIDDQGNVYLGGGEHKVIKIKQEGDTKITGYEVIK